MLAQSDDFVGAADLPVDAGTVRFWPVFATDGLGRAANCHGICLAFRERARTAMSALSNLTEKQYMLNRVRGEFLEMPGLRLRVDQAQRLWGLDRPTCEELLKSL